MKIRFLILFLVTASVLYAQNSLKHDSAIRFLEDQRIKLNSVTPPAGFTVYYNCDSLLFMKGVFGDTIKIWTTVTDWYQDLKEFKDIIKNESFGKTQFVKDVDHDGRFYVSTYHQTEFIYRNDSLFEIGNSNPAPSGPIMELFSDYFSEKIDKKVYKRRLDSLHQIGEKLAVYTPKLIFAKNMFQQTNKLKLPKEVNFQEDTIELERQWSQNGKTCYLVRIKNKLDGQETTYAYAINQDMKFVFWEGCDEQ